MIIFQKNPLRACMFECCGLALRRVLRTVSLLLFCVCLFAMVTPCYSEELPYHGTFSSMYYHEQGGDLLGTELKIVWVDNKGYQGVLQFAEGDANELILIWPEIDGDRISFDYSSEWHSGRFDGVYTEYGIQPVEPDKGSWWNLKRQPSYWDEYRNENTAPWPE